MIDIGTTQEAGIRSKYDKIIIYNFFFTHIDHITNKVENKIAGCLPDSRGMLATMYVNDRYREKRKRQEYEANMIKLKFIIFCLQTLINMTN